MIPNCCTQMLYIVSCILLIYNSHCIRWIRMIIIWGRPMMSCDFSKSNPFLLVTFLHNAVDFPYEMTPQIYRSTSHQNTTLLFPPLGSWSHLYFYTVLKRTLQWSFRKLTTMGTPKLSAESREIRCAKGAEYRAQKARESKRRRCWVGGVCEGVSPPQPTRGSGGAS